MNKKSFLAVCLIFPMVAVVAGCGTLTGIPSHGGGKRFAIEQELVSGTARAATKGFDVSGLVGKRVAVYMTSIGDVGTGNLFGGRLSLSSALLGEAVHSPVTQERAQFGVLDTVATTQNNANTQSTSASVSDSFSSSRNNETLSAETQANGADTTTTTESENAGNGFSDSATDTTSRSDTAGSTTTRAQVVTAQPVQRETQVRNNDGVNATIGLNYDGIGGYSNSQVIVARDTQFLSAIIQKYLVLNGVIVVPPEYADIDVYITVDVFGTIRSRKDWLVKNGEILKAKTAMELAAINRKTGEVVVSPQVSSYEAEYKEDFSFWVGPYKTSKDIKESDGLLADYTTLVRTSN